MPTQFLSQLFEKEAKRPVGFSIVAGQQVVRFHFPDEGLRQYFRPPFAHLLVEEQPQDLDVFCCLNSLDVTAWLTEHQLESKPHKTFRVDAIRYCSQENGLFWIDQKSRKGFFIGNSLEAFESYRSKPLSRLMCWFFEDLSKLWCHGACVGNEHGGVLLPGIGGAGKSTTVGAALLGGLQFLGDDYLLIEPGGQTVYGLYSSLMLGEDSGELLRPFPNAGLLRPEFLGNKDKWCHYLHPSFQSQLVAQLPLKAILIPQIVRQEDSFLSPASRGEVMNALVSSLQTVWLMGSDPAWLLREFYRLTETVPIGKLNAGSDLTQVPPLIESYLKQLA